MIILAWFIGAAGVGLLALISVFPAILEMIVSLRIERGVIFYSTKYISEGNLEELRNFFYSYIIFKFFIGTLVALINMLTSEYIAINVFHNNALVKYIKLYTIVIVPLSLYHLNELYFRTRLMFKEWMISSAVLATIRTALAYIVLLSSYGIEGLIIVDAIWYASYFFVGLTCLLVFLSRNNVSISSYKFSSFLQENAKAIKYSTPLFIESFYGTVRTNIDIWLLGWLFNEHIVGVYCIARDLLLRTLGLLRPIYTSALTVAFNYFHTKGEEKLRENVVELLKFALIFSVPVFGLCFVIPHQILGFFYPTEFLEGATYFQVLSFEILFFAISNSLAVLYIAGGKPWTIGKLSMLNFAITLITSSILISCMGATGAAIAYVCPTLVQSTLLWVFIRPSVGKLFEKITLSIIPSLSLVYIALYSGVLFDRPTTVSISILFILVFHLTFYAVKGYREISPNILYQITKSLPQPLRDLIQKILFK